MARVGIERGTSRLIAGYLFRCAIISIGITRGKPIINNNNKKSIDEAYISTPISLYPVTSGFTPTSVACDGTS